MKDASSYVKVPRSTLEVAASDWLKELKARKQSDVDGTLEDLRNTPIRCMPFFWRKRLRTEEEVLRAFSEGDIIYSLEDRISIRYDYSIQLAENLLSLSRVESSDGRVLLSMEDAVFLGLGDP